MTLGYAEAAAKVTSPGMRFEIRPITIAGVEMNAFANVPRTLREALDERRDRSVFIVFDDEHWTFEDVMRQADALAVVLVERYGITKGDRVAIGMRNLPEWVVAYVATVSIGAVSVSLNAWWTEDELSYAMHDSGSALLIADQERIDRTRSAARSLRFATMGVRGAAGDGVDPWDLPLGRTPPPVYVQPDDDATILYTSGTTGHPKGAVSTHRAILQALTAWACGEELEQARRGEEPLPPSTAGNPVVLLAVPLFHVTGCVAVMLSSFLAGVRMVMMARWDPARALELIEREGVTEFIGVPTQTWDLIHCPDHSRRDISSLRSIGGGGAPAAPEMARQIVEALGGVPNIGYGMTETNGYGPGHGGEDYLAHPTSVGRFVPILEISVRDAGGQPVPTGTHGEIWFKGPHLIRGYWNNPEATKSTIVNGWLRSGDIGSIDADGLVYVVDRLKDMVIRAGENIYCSEVEAAIYEHPGVIEVAVFGVPDQRLGEVVGAVIVLRPEASLTTDGLTEFLHHRIAAYKAPTVVKFRTEPLPRNANGKFLKRELSRGANKTP